MKLKHCRIVILLGLYVSLYQTPTVVSQIQNHRLPNNGIPGIPPQHRHSLNSSLQRFIEAQAAEEWDEVALWLGRFRSKSGGLCYTPEQKECLLSQMRSSPIISFTVEKTTASTEILSVPDGKRWWWLTGMAEMKTSSGTTTSRIQITAYQDGGQWYFTPPENDEWVRRKFTEADFSVERNGNLEIQLDPHCPLSLSEIRVVMDRQFLSLRNLTFALQNKSNKKIVHYTLFLGKAGTPCFDMMQSDPLTIEPHQTISGGGALKYSAYTYYCEGEAKRRLVISSVSFLGGSKWVDPRFRTKRPSLNCFFGSRDFHNETAQPSHARGFASAGRFNKGQFGGRFANR
ncbi:MAG: hypothetical protein K1Y36_30905 [Blastocatellia bacterium]|nr:hypothetical protein [Blastocatellia bacterium]